jgi:hypothetical protein
MPSEDPRIAILQGTLDMIVLRTLETLGPQHAYGIATRLEQISEDLLRLNQGTLYPALVRLEQVRKEGTRTRNTTLATNYRTSGKVAFGRSLIYAPIPREISQPV